ncbi:MAG: class I SAM-dependent methyltransferase [Puniceicoccaceae bacterium]|nr:MAG: class I SAM-dependent methyltransferase [Puniceicoccaceae bacterium]
MQKPTPSVDIAGITKRQQATWSSGDFNQIARQNVGMAEALCESADPHGGERVLDLACGSGTAALVAARRYCEVTGIDYVPELIECARKRAAADGVEAEFVVGDAQSLPFPDAAFDVVLSVYGMQFAPDQKTAAAELLRVCRPGGRIALASPCPEGWSADFFAAIAKHASPPAGVPSPLQWGTEAGVEALLGPGVTSLHNERRTALQYYRSINHATEVFLTWFGPAIRATQEAGSKERVGDDLKTVFNRYNRARDGTAVIENTYLLTLAARLQAHG